MVCVTALSAQVVRLSGGTFFMGSETGDDDERPVRSVTLSSFGIDRYEVTGAQYDSCVESGRCTAAHYDDGTCRLWNGRNFVKIRIPASGRDPSYPVVCVTWSEARQFCAARGMSLPTEAQWEYAARAGIGGRYNRDAGENSGRCVVSRTSGPGRVGSCPANSGGLHDMLGNAWEWVNDLYDPAQYRMPDAGEPAGPAAGFYRVIRGGGWYSSPEQATVSNRHWFSPDFPEASIGFRCVSR